MWCAAFTRSGVDAVHCVRTAMQAFMFPDGRKALEQPPRLIVATACRAQPVRYLQAYGDSMDFKRKTIMLKTILEIVTLLAIGWVSGAEIGSWFGIQPIVGRLPYEQQVNLEQEMLKSFGKVMPIIMPFSAVVAIVLAVFSRNDPSVVMWLRI